jgi:hypothetical protein
MACLVLMQPEPPQAILEWEAREHERSGARSEAQHGVGGGGRAQGEGRGNGDTEGEGGEGEGVGAAARFVAYVPLPDQRAIEEAVLAKKKADLLAKCGLGHLHAPWALPTTLPALA